MVVYPETRGTLVDMAIDFLTFSDNDINRYSPNKLYGSWWNIGYFFETLDYENSWNSMVKKLIFKIVANQTVICTKVFKISEHTKGFMSSK